MSSLLRFVAFGFVGIGVCACAGAPTPESTPPAPVVMPTSDPPPVRLKTTLSFLGTNDLHGRLKALPAFSGYVTNVRRARAADNGGVALVDAGDMFQGTLESNLTEGASVVTAYNTLGMSVATLGNHEFDFGPEGEANQGDPQGAIRARIREAAFPILSANLVVKGSHDTPNWEKLRRSVIIPVAGVKVGFVGLLTKETPSIVRSSWFAGLDVDDLAPALEREAKALRASGAEIVIGIAHAGADCTEFSDPTSLTSCKKEAEIFDVARAMPAGLVNAIFGGHTHAGVAQIVNGIPIAEAYARGHSFSRIDLELDAATHHVNKFTVFPPHDLCPKLADGGDCPLGTYEDQAVVEDPAMLTVITPALEKAEALRKSPLGTTASEPIRGEHGKESPLGNLFADLLREAVKGADASIINGGTLRGDLPAGPLDYGALFETMPFDNTTATIRVTGAELKALLIKHLSREAHGLVSVSGIRVSARCGKSGLDVKIARANGTPVSDRDMLTIATSDYLATGGDDLISGLNLPADRIHIDDALSFREALVRSLKHHPELSPKDKATFDPGRPRLTLSAARPIVCGR